MFRLKNRIRGFFHRSQAQIKTRSTSEAARKQRRQREEQLYARLLANHQSLSEVTYSGKN